MQNDEASKPPRPPRDLTDSSEAYKVFSVPMIGYGVGVAQHDIRLIGISVAIWGGLYLVSVPFVARRVALRSPPGDSLRAAASLAAGALPWSLYIPLWRQLTTPKALLIAYPVLFVWCCTAYVMALRSNPPPLTPARRLFVLGGGAALYGVIALVSGGGAAFILVLLLLGPAPFATLAILLALIATGGSLSALSGWAALRLWAAARDA